MSKALFWTRGHDCIKTMINEAKWHNHAQLGQATIIIYLSYVISFERERKQFWTVWNLWALICPDAQGRQQGYSTPAQGLQGLTWTWAERGQIVPVIRMADARNHTIMELLNLVETTLLVAGSGMQGFSDMPDQKWEWKCHAGGNDEYFCTPYHLPWWQNSYSNSKFVYLTQLQLSHVI